MTAPKQSPELQRMLGSLLRDAPPAQRGRVDPQQALIRNRAIQQLMAAKVLEAAEEQEPGFTERYGLEQDPKRVIEATLTAQQAAEAKWPGFRALFNQLIQRETEFMDAAGPQA